MKRIFALFLTVLLSFAAIIVLIGCEPYEKYEKTDYLEPKRAYVFSLKQPHSDAAAIIKSYDEYLSYGVDLNYGEEFFENNHLLFVVKIGCSSDAYKFAEIRKDGTTLYPIIAEHISDVCTDDIRPYVFYAELPASENYKLGKTTFTDEYKADYANRKLTSIDLHYANINKTQSIEVRFSGTFEGSLVIEDADTIDTIVETLLAREYEFVIPPRIYGPSPYSVLLTFNCENEKTVTLDTSTLSRDNGEYAPVSKDGLDELLITIGQNKNAITIG